MPADDTTLLAHAQFLDQAVRSGTARALLRGKKLALLSASHDSGESHLFTRAARELGAHVACIPPSLHESSDSADVQETSRMLGHLYDALACEGLAQSLVEQIRRGAGIPVFDGAASAGHATAALAARVDAVEAPLDKRCRILQALLWSTLSPR